MMDNLYFLEHESRARLDAARALARRDMLAARASTGPSRMETLLARLSRYLRWSSAASAGSKPTTARAWSMSR